MHWNLVFLVLRYWAREKESDMRSERNIGIVAQFSQLTQIQRQMFIHAIEIISTICQTQ